MTLITKTHTFTAGATILASEHNTNFNTIYDDYNGNITNANIKSTAAIADSKLAQITTASKVSGAALTSLSSIPAGAGSIPAANVTDWALTSQAAGDLAYFDGANWVRLADGTANQFLESDGAGNLTWVDDVQVEDYGTSASTSTAKNQKALKICYGTLTIAGSSNSALSNLPFTSSSSYTIVATFGTNQSATEAIEVVQSSGSAATIYNQDDQSQAIHWIAIGT